MRAKSIYLHSMKAPSIKTQIAHHHKIVSAFNQLIEKKAVRITGTTIFLYPDLLPADQAAKQAWIKNAYGYLRLQHRITEGSPIYLKHIETSQLLAKYHAG